MCYEAIGLSGGKYVALESFPTMVQYTRRDVVASWIMGPRVFGEGVSATGGMGGPCQARIGVFGAVFQDGGGDAGEEVN